MRGLDDFTALQAFKALDVNTRGSVMHADVKDYLRKNGHLSTDSDLVAIVRRMDKNNDG